MNPFDIKTIFLAKHAQHVVLIHFPIALFILGAVLDFLGQRKKNQLLTGAAYYNFLAAAIMTIPVMITGVLAWQWQLEGERPKGILLMHLVLGWVSSVLIWITWLIHKRAQRNPERILPGYRLPIEALAVLVVALTAHLGGFLSGVNGAS
ncbi:MAG TPA: DUF2231 domain-containing protein [Candidatus Limnocylindrales bacterium]|nr:DUF2231 domain-containing protein [Candidatus Limnocylindrales bacterium]